jgi:hypothetical protein
MNAPGGGKIFPPPFYFVKSIWNKSFFSASCHGNGAPTKGAPS